MQTPSRGRALALLALVAASMVALEVLVTRVLSVLTWYGLAFVALSLAMLGLTRGGLVAARAQRDGLPLGPWLAARLVSLSLGVLCATAVLVSVPLGFALNATALVSMVVVSAAIAWPMVEGGAVIARLMAESTVPLPLLYGVDLAAAAGGALLPLAMLGPFSGPGALVALSAALALASFALDADGAVKRRAGALALASVALVALTELTSHGLVIRYPKGLPRDEREVTLFERWNALSYVRVPDYRTVGNNFMWSPSPATPPGTLTAANAVIDGEAATPVYAYRRPEHLNVLRFDATATAHALRPHGTACVIGVGGGRDLIIALAAGHERVVGVEINPSMVAMLRAVSRRTPILDDRRAVVVVGDGRAVYARAPMQCSVLQASLVDTWAATGAGAFAHTESTLYTREAWGVFLRRVEPSGVLTFSRWYDPERVSETARLVSLAVASLLDRGVANPERHVALIAAGTVATILVSPEPFYDQDRENLRAHVTRMRYRWLIEPGRAPDDPLLARILRARSHDALARAGVEQGLDTSAPTDDRPFFFQLLRPSAWLHPVEALRTARYSAGVLAGNATAMFELLLTFIAVAAVGAALLGGTLVDAARGRSKALPSLRAGAYFAALGAGFMAVELGLVQRMHVVLGHPSYALVVVLAGLLVSTGVGSALSPRVLRTRGAVRVAALATAGLLAALPWVVIAPLARATVDASFAVRAAWTGGTAALVGLALGMFFPSGVRWLSREDAAPLALALNGATSVLGSVIALTVSVWFGIPWTFVAAAVCYLVVAWASPPSWPDAG